MAKRRKFRGVLAACVAINLSALFYASPVQAQALSVLGGLSRSPSSSQGTYAWGFTYMQPLDASQALSYSWLNEGHLSDNDRDGFALQYWRSVHFFNNQLELAAGIGAYAYFDTVPAAQGQPYQNDHGVALIYSLSATWYTHTPWFYQMVVNRVNAKQSIDTTTAMLGIGYQLGTTKQAASTESTPAAGSGDQLSVLAGQTVVNSERSPAAFAKSIEYRHGFSPYVDGTLTWLDEGSTVLTQRNGVAAQAWLGNNFFDDHLHLSVGAGPYVAFDTYKIRGGLETGDKITALLTMSASYNISEHWLMRASWDRVLTGYDKDSDIFLAGAGYRF